MQNCIMQNCIMQNSETEATMNPFKYGSTVSGEYFCRRPELARALAEYVKSGQNAEATLSALRPTWGGGHDKKVVFGPSC